ncbi:RimK family alpha-L-glutamate ligase [Kitasatospora sp. NPDC088134]|uniref:ATP-grasp domain-containing protein n=1 Tax=Kitasatospora sp. NPDC088134 TaxID=3364071 RepID=UPI00380E91E4
MSTRIALLTGRTMPLDVPEDDLLVRALADRGLTADVLPWDEPADWSAYGLALVRTTWDYWQRHEEFLAALREIGGRTKLRNPVGLVAWNSHKGYLLELAAAGVPVLPTRLVPAGADPERRAAALAAFGTDAALVVKPAVSVGARDTIRTTAGDPAAAAHLAELVGSGRDTLVQPLAESVLTRGETSLVFLGGSFSHAVRKSAAPGDYRIHQYLGGTVHPHDPSGAELAAAEAALAAAPHGGQLEYARVDLVLDAAGDPCLMELELIEPELFLFQQDAAPAARYAARIEALLAD